MTVAADPASLGRYVEIGRACRLDLVRSTNRVAALSEAVRRRCTGVPVPERVLDRVDGALHLLERTEQVVTTIRLDLLGADTGSPLAVRPGPRVPTVRGDAVPATPTGSGLNPWLDPDSASGVVNLVRLGTGQRPTWPFLKRLVEEGPQAVGVLVRAVDVLSPPNQNRLLVTDPAQFAANWGRAGGGAAEALGGFAALAAGLAALGVPGGGEAIGQVTGWRPDRELVAQAKGAAQLLAADPDSFGRALIGWDELRDDPYRWAGAQAPDVVLEILSSGGAAALRAGRLPILVRRGDDLLSAPAGSLRRSSPFPDLDLQRAAEREWAPAGPVVSRRQGSFESPEGWASEVNGSGTAAPGRNVNCVDCTRAVESNWRGREAVAAPLAPGAGRGAGAHLLEDWTGGYLVPTTMSDVRQRLKGLGHGSSALVVSQWGSGRAHAYNAVNDAGAIKWVDGQTGQVSSWPPPYAQGISASLAIFIDPGGQPRVP